MSDLFDYREEEDEARAYPLHIEEVTSKCINCRALVTYSVNAQTEHCRRCQTEIQPKHDSDVDKLQPLVERPTTHRQGRKSRRN